MAVAQERVPQGFQRTAELQRQRCSHRGITSVCVALASWLSALKENLADRAIGISADGRREVLAGDFKLEAFAGAAVFESLPHAGVRPFARNSAQGGRSITSPLGSCSGGLGVNQGLLATGAGLEPTSPACTGALAIELPWFILPLHCGLAFLDVC